MICCMFPGQPMAVANLPDDDYAFNELAQRCREISGIDFQSDRAYPPHISESIRLQMFGTTMSLYRYQQLTAQHGLPDIIAEHSMGIYAALAACGSIDALAALELTWRIGACLANMGSRKEYALGSVVGLPTEPLTVITSNHGVYIANYNTSRHHLLAGTREQIRLATLAAEAAGAFSVGVFPCNAPLHTPLVDEIADELRLIVADYEFREPTIALVSHLDQKQLKATDIPVFLVEELCQPVFWEKSYRELRYKGVQRFHEAGVGQALTKFNRWIESEL